MSDDKHDKGKPPERPAGDGGSKRPFATIDIKAVEIAAKDQAAVTASRIAAAVPATPTSVPSGIGGASGGSGPVKPAAAKPEAKPAATSAAAKDKPAAPAASSVASAASSGPTAARPAGSGHFLSHLAAGVAGAVLTLVGASTLLPQLLDTSSGRAGGDSAAVPAELVQRLAALEQAARNRTGNPASDLPDRLRAAEGQLARIGDVDKALAGLADAQAKLASEARALEARLAQSQPDATQRLVRLEETLNTLVASGADPQRSGPLPQLARLSAKLADLEIALANRTAALRKDVVTEVETRVASIGEASEAAKTGTARVDREMAAVKTDASRLAARIDTMKTGADQIEQTLRRMQEEASGIRSGFEALKADLAQRMKPADVAAAIAPVASRIAGIEQGLQGVVKSEQERNSTAEKIVLSLELANLKRALDRGAKFDAELAAVKKLGGDRIDTAALDAARAEGVPTPAALAQEFRRLADRMLDIDAQPADAGVVDRLMQGAKSIVRIRKINHAATDTSAEAQIGRMETALKENRLADVLAEAARLAERTRAPADAWLKKVEARAAIDKALAAIEAQLKTTLAGSALPKEQK